MKHCTQCGHVLGLGRFCTNCGHPVAARHADPLSDPIDARLGRRAEQSPQADPVATGRGPRRRGLADQHRGAGAAAGRPARAGRHDRPGGAGHAAHPAGRRRASAATPLPALRRRGGGPGRRRRRPGGRGPPRSRLPSSSRSPRRCPPGPRRTPTTRTTTSTTTRTGTTGTTTGAGARCGSWARWCCWRRSSRARGSWARHWATTAPRTTRRAPAPPTRPRSRSTTPLTPPPRRPGRRRPRRTSTATPRPTTPATCSTACRRRPGGRPATASGLKLVFTFPEKVRISEVGLINGYAKTATDDAGKTFDWYAGHRRITQVTWNFGVGPVVRQDLEDGRDVQTIDVEPVETRKLVLKIVATTPPGQGPAAPRLHRDQRGPPGRLSLRRLRAAPGRPPPPRRRRG